MDDGGCVTIACAMMDAGSDSGNLGSIDLFISLFLIDLYRLIGPSCGYLHEWSQWFNQKQ